MTLRLAIEREDERFRHELKAAVESTDDVEAVVFKLQEESKRRQAEIFREHHYGELVILQFPEPEPPRAA